MSNAVQSEIAIVNTVNLKMSDKDYYAVLLANQILGGGGTGRLYKNLREDKGYTYGAYSGIGASRYVSRFRAGASVRNMVTDSAIVETMKEINKVRYQKVTQRELDIAKAKYLGNFVKAVERPSTIASYALNILIYNLPENYYENYLSNFNAVTIDDVQDAAIKYFKADKARIIITVKGIDVLKNLEKTDYIIKYFDKEGNPTKKPKMTLPIPEGVTAASVIDSYFNAIGGADKITAIKTLAMTYNATIQGTPIVLTTKVAAPNKTTNTISVMGQTMQKQAFNGENGYNEMRGQKKEFDEKEINKSKSNTAPFSDMSYKNGLLDRIEPIDGKNAYVIKSGTTEIYYDVATGLKLQSVEVLKTPDGKETKVPTIFSDYKEVGGVLFAHKRDQVTPQFTLNFVLQDVKINEGEFIAIVGESGSGKSTLLRILLGFEEYQKGTVSYNGTDMKDIDIRSVRDQTGVVLQDGKIMEGTVLYNIVGTSDYTVEEAWAAAKMAGCDKDIEGLEQQMNTVLPAGGGVLSGGQQQRIVIARAIIRDPKLIIFDEATSALDNDTQKTVTENLDKLKITKIVIAHRLSTIKNADTIVVLENGEITEKGSYDSLVKNKSFFYNLVKNQMN